jgi:hypothetical protein
MNRLERLLFYLTVIGRSILDAVMGAIVGAVIAGILALVVFFGAICYHVFQGQYIGPADTVMPMFYVTKNVFHTAVIAFPVLGALVGFLSRLFRELREE